MGQLKAINGVCSSFFPSAEERPLGYRATITRISLSWFWYIKILFFCSREATTIYLRQEAFLVFRDNDGRTGKLINKHLYTPRSNKVTVVVYYNVCLFVIFATFSKRRKLIRYRSCDHTEKDSCFFMNIDLTYGRLISFLLLLDHLIICICAQIQISFSLALL